MKEKEMPDRDIQILSDFYSKHHLTGNRRNQSVSEEKRSQLFKKTQHTCGYSDRWGILKG